MSSGKVKCTCGWSWNKSDSSKKDMYICHECGKDNSNNMKNGGWLDNYADGGTMQEHQENYNDPQVSLPEGFVGMGNNTKGRNYSPAWGGQFEDGGSVYPVNYVPEAQWGLPVSPFTPLAPLALRAANEVKSWFSDDDEPVKPIKKPVTKGKPRTLNIVDPRKKMATTNQPLRPNSDLVGGKYNSNHLDKLMQEAKRQKLSKQDMMNLSAMGFQETKWGKSDGNIGHVLGNWKGNDSYQQFISAYKEKMKEADRLGIKDPATRLQVYNGLGTVTPKTEKHYHGFEMQKIYGVPIPKGGINMKKNPLYGKQVMDIRDNVLAKNPEYLQYMDSIYKAPVPGYMEEVNKNKLKVPALIHDGNSGSFPKTKGFAPMLDKHQMGGSIPGTVGFSYARTNDPAPDNGPGAKKTMASAQGGKKVQSKEKKWLGNTLTPEGWVTSTTKGGNYISFTGNQRSDEWINKQIDTGKFGFDPETQTTFPLKKPVKGLSKEDRFMATKQYHDLRAPEGFTNESQQAEIEKLPEWQQDMLNAENTNRRKRVVYNSMQDVVKNPLFYAPGAIALAPIAAAGLTEAGILASPYIESALATQLPGMATVPGATVGNAITAGFAGHGLANIGPDAVEMYENPSWGNFGNLAMDVAEVAPIVGPAAKTVAESYNATKQGINKGVELINKVPYGETAIPFAWKSRANQLGQIESQAMFDAIKQSEKLTEAEKVLLAEYQFDSAPFTGTGFGSSPEKRAALQKIIDKVNPEFQSNTVLTRRINADNASLFNNENGIIQIGDRPTSFSAGLGADANFGKDRFVLSGQNAKAVEANFLKNPYEELAPQTIDDLQNFTDITHPGFTGKPESYTNYKGEVMTNMPLTDNAGFVNELNQTAVEKELIGSGFDFKQLGKVKNDLGGYDYIVKPTNIQNRNIFNETPIQRQGFFTPLIQKAGKALGTEEGLLSNTWKLNPRAYQYNLPENTMWRGLGKQGMEDAVSSGLFRSKQNVAAEFFPGSTLRMDKSFGTNPYFTPKFETASTYGDNFLAEVPRDAANWRNRYARTDWSQVADKPIPIDQGRILQKDWLQGYKEIPKQEDGGVIKDDMGYWNPDNWGSPVEIGSTDITMEGVYEPLLGISDTGDTKLMKPGKNYKFKGKKVTEYPMAKNGLRQEQKGLVNLDQLTNFTNYNTKQPGGWLDKY